MTEIRVDNLKSGAVIQLLEEHLADMYAHSPPESVHALDVIALREPAITFWSATHDSQVLGCVAIKELSPTHAEIKSMRTSAAARGRGIASALLRHVIAVANKRKYQRLSLETGSMDFFIPARRLYAKHNFSECGPFSDYQDDPNSCFMTLEITQTVP